jgi:patatin-like phospholipase/acyl hydrolase
MLGCPLYKRFDLIFGTSTGSIIGALLAIGCEVDQIHELYKERVGKPASTWLELRNGNRNPSARQSSGRLPTGSTINEKKGGEELSGGHLH